MQTFPIMILSKDLNFHGMGAGDPSYRFPTTDVMQLLLENRERMLQDFINSSVIIDDSSSFPFRDGGSLQYPDVVHLLALDGILFDLRVIALSRNPLNAIFSATRSTYMSGESSFKTLEYQTRVTEEAMVSLNNALMLVPCSQLLWIDFECFIHDPTQYFKPIASLLSLPEDTVRLSSPLTYVPSSSEIFLKDDIRIVENFLKSHDQLWPHIHSRPACRRPESAGNGITIEYANNNSRTRSVVVN